MYTTIACECNIKFWFYHACVWVRVIGTLVVILSVCQPSLSGHQMRTSHALQPLILMGKVILTVLCSSVAQANRFVKIEL